MVGVEIMVLLVLLLMLMGLLLVLTAVVRSAAVDVMVPMQASSRLEYYNIKIVSLVQISPD